MTSRDPACVGRLAKTSRRGALRICSRCYRFFCSDAEMTRHICPGR